VYNKKETMVLSSMGSISFSQIASEWRLNSDGSIPLSLSRLSNFKRPTYVDNLGKFRTWPWISEVVLNNINLMKQADQNLMSLTERY
jgi:hypothetical protein